MENHMSSNSVKQAILYNFKNHWTCRGDVFKVGGRDYFFKYSIFPHGHLDCLEGSISFDQKLCDEIEKQRQIAFETKGIASRGINVYSRIINEVGASYLETLDKTGKVCREKIKQ